MALPTVASTGMPQKALKQVQGTGTLAATGDATIIAAPGANKHTRLLKAVVSVSITADTAVLALEDGAGGSRLWQIKANAADDSGVSGTTHVIDFGPIGLELSANTVLNLTCETANATAHCTAIGYVV